MRGQEGERMGSYLLGIDAGATKTAFALYDLSADRTWLHLAGCGNHEGLEGGYEEFSQMMEKEIRTLLAHAGAGMGQIAMAGLGIAGVDTRRQHAIISDIYASMGLPHFVLGNDALLGIKAECTSGLCAVNGTGFCVCGIDDEGRTVQIGGLGNDTGDRGGGDYYASTALAAVYDALEKQGEPTGMTEPVLQLLQVPEPSAFTEQLSERLESGQREAFTKQVCMILHDAARNGDRVAMSILRVSGSCYGASLLGALSHLPRVLEHAPVRVILVGSCFLKVSCSLTRQTMEETLHAHMPDTAFEIQPIRSAPVFGALLWARDAAGIGEAGLPADRLNASYLRAEYTESGPR